MVVLLSHILLPGHQQSSADSSAADTQQREHQQQHLAARLAQLPSSNGHAKEQQQQQQIPQQLSDADAVQAWQLRHSELQELQDKGRAGGWLTNPSEVCSCAELR